MGRATAAFEADRAGQNWTGGVDRGGQNWTGGVDRGGQNWTDLVRAANVLAGVTGIPRPGNKTSVSAVSPLVTMPLVTIPRPGNMVSVALEVLIMLDLGCASYTGHGVNRFT